MPLNKARPRSDPYSFNRPIRHGDGPGELRRWRQPMVQMREAEGDEPDPRAHPDSVPRPAAGVEQGQPRKRMH